MGINNISNTAFEGLQIAQAGMLITSDNVTGSSVAGFTKRTANTALDRMAPNSLALNGTSFAVDGFTRSYSSLIGSQLLTQQALSSNSDTLVQYTQSIDSLVSDQNTGLTSSLTAFFNAMGTYAADPTSQTSAAAITSSANDVATRLSGMSSISDQLLSQAKSGLTDTVKQVNTLLPELASVNAQITAGTSPGNTSPSADLLDERDRILTSLQKLVGGQSLINGDGTATQLVNGIPLVERGIANTMTISSDQTQIGVKFNSKDNLGNPNGQTLQGIDGGQGAALLQIINGFVPSIEQRLNSIAIGLVKVANSAGQSTPGSATNVPIFGFKVGNAVFSSLKAGSTDPTGSLPNISSDEDLTNFYNSLKNVITSPLINSGTTVGSFSKVSSIFADTTKAAPNSYTLSQVLDANGNPTNQIKLTPNPVNGVQGLSQTVSIANGSLGASQSINFSQYGISVNISNPANYASTGIIGLYSGQTIGNQNVTSVFSGTSAAMGGYQIAAGATAGTIKLTGPNGYVSPDVTLANGTAGVQLIKFNNGVQIEIADNGAGDNATTIANQLRGTTFTVGIHAGNTVTPVYTAGTASSNAKDAYNLSSLSLASGDSIKIGSVTFTANANTSGASLVSQFTAYLNSGTAGTSGQFSNTGVSNTISGWTGAATNNGGILTLSAAGVGATPDLGFATLMYSGKATVSTISANTNAQPGMYQLSSSGGNLTLAANINGTPISQTIALSDIGVNSSQAISFGNLGITLTVNNGNTALTAQTLAQQLAGSSPTNQISIAPGIDTGLDLATSLNNQTFSVTGQTNSALTYGLTAENFVSLAPSDPSGYMNGTTPYISSAAANAVSSMNSVFGNAVANLVSDVGTKVATWKNNQTANTAVLNNIQSQSDSISGVNLDEEAANLLKYQQLYSASSKVLQSGNEMFTALLAIMT